jgi:hypothetical protein
MSLLSVPIEMRMWPSLSQFIPKMSKVSLPDLNGFLEITALRHRIKKFSRVNGVPRTHELA